LHTARRLVFQLAFALLLARAATTHAATVTGVFARRIPCHVESGVQFCNGTRATRVESWDGVPLDVSLTLPPASMSPPFPLIVELHGWSLGKTATPFVERALAGYAVLSYSARGFHESCGSVASRAPDPSLRDPDVCTKRGWTHLADARYEGHDTQFLAGLLVDEQLVVADRIGVTGASYGGGQSMILAALKDRVMLPDDALVAWTSPAGRPLRIAAAAPLIPWSDLAYALVPNGSTLDYRVHNDYGTRIGVQKESWNATLYAAGLSTGFYAPPGVDPGADLVTWNARIGAGEPYDGDPAVEQILAEIERHHSAYAIDDSVEPAPLFIYNAWTDDLFPADEALRYWRKIKHRHPGAEIALHFADAFGHPRASLSGDFARVQTRVEVFLAQHLKSPPPPLPLLPSLETYTQACGGASAAGPFIASDWDAVHPGEVRFLDPAGKRFTSSGGNQETARALDPLAGGPCRTVPATDDPGAATYRLPAATGAGYTLLGSPTVIANFTVRGRYAEIAARLWDVDPDGSQTLVSHSLYRPRANESGLQVLQLHPNGWTFAVGHVPKLELLGQSVPYGRASNGSFTITATNLQLRLPVLDPPDGKVVRAPAPPVFPRPETSFSARRAWCRTSTSSLQGLPACRTLPVLGSTHRAR
jgi:hypothetical protein